MKLISAILVSVLFASCTPYTKAVNPSKIVTYGTDPLYHTSYNGSDETYHYFQNIHGLMMRSLKVRKEDLELAETFPINSGKRRLMIRNSSGELIFQKSNR